MTEPAAESPILVAVRAAIVSAFVEVDNARDEPPSREQLDQAHIAACAVLNGFAVSPADPLAESGEADHVVVSVYVRPDGRRVVHAWGPAATRRGATNRAARMRRADRREYGDRLDRDMLTLHVCEISGDER